MTLLSLKCFSVNSQNNLLQDFTRHQSAIDRPVITRVFLLTLLENRDNICQLPVNWDLSRLPRLLKNNGERSHDNVGELFPYPGMNPIGPQRLTCIQLEQQVPNSSEPAGTLSSPQSWSSNTGLQGSQDPPLVLKMEVKKALNVSALSVSL